MYHSINQHPEVMTGRYNLAKRSKLAFPVPLPLLRETKDRFEKLTGGKLIEGYGLSEAPTATHCNPMFGDNRAGSIGLPLPDVESRIVDLQMGEKDVLPGEAGELVVRGPQVMQGYHNMPDETAPDIAKWLALYRGYSPGWIRMDIFI
jgi:long-chain acyl-CoA synthetase